MILTAVYLLGHPLLMPILLDETHSHTRAHAFSDKALIQNTISMQVPLISDCYRTDLKRFRQSEGLIILQFAVNQNGDVRDLVVKYSTLNSQEVTECVLSVFEGMRFPTGIQTDIVSSSSHSQDSFVVTYPLRFVLQ